MTEVVTVPKDSLGRPMHLYRHGEAHGTNRTKEYRAWAHAKGRCHNPSDHAYALYGARGIQMAPEWRESFETFLAELGRRQHSLDRIDNSRGYEPGNCRWATHGEQSRNTRRTVVIDGQSLIDLCREKGLSYGAVQARLRRGDPPAIATTNLTGGAYRRLVAEARNG